MKRMVIMGALALAGIVSSCDSKPQGYTISGTIPADAQANDAYVYLRVASEDGPKVIDSAKVQNNAFAFALREPADLMAEAAVVFERAYSTPLILESGDIKVDMKAVAATGTKLNGELFAYMTSRDSLVASLKERMQALSDKSDEEKNAGMEQLDQEYNDFVKSNAERMLAQHKDDALGVRALKSLISVSEINTKEELERLKQSATPALLDNPAIKTVLESIERTIATQPGEMFVDFEGVDDAGQPNKLSDFVGNGHYTLVDFWASWCGPCRREMPNLIKVRDKYASKGLQILGVAVWDEMDAHLKAVQDLDITWPQVFNKDEATKLYGIRGIPQIMLFAPDGTIVARDLRGEAISEKLDEILANSNDKL